MGFIQKASLPTRVKCYYIIVNMTEFTKSVVQVVRAIPAGQVVSYGQVAAYVGGPRAARAVGWILRQLEEVDLPWWRVINNAGRISIKGNIYNDANSQRDHLRDDGVEVGKDFSVDIKKYRYIASEDQLKSWGLDTYYVQMIWDKFRRGF